MMLEEPMPRELHDFNHATLREHVFPGIDAAVVFVPSGNKSPPEVQSVIDKASQVRWYPVPGGFEAKVPWPLVTSAESLFKREEKGWDHEHCDFCNATISIGETCWSSDVGDSFVLFCRGCRDKLNAAT
jgi:hypothetical protein